MSFIDKLYNLKKNLIKNIKQLYTAYFTVEGTYTSLLPDKIYIKKLYKKLMGKELNLKNPVTFNEKLNWIKFYDRRPEYTMMADKYRARDYIKEKIGEEYLVPLLGVYEKAEEIDFDALPNQFVLKCNHDSEVVICRDKENNDFFCKKGKLNSVTEVKAYLDKRLNINFFKASREWPYKHIKRKIICEKYMTDGVNDSLIDYKFFCFNGVPGLVYIANTQHGELRIDFFDAEYNHLPVSRLDHPNLSSDFDFSPPDGFEKMKLLAAKLAEGIPQVRIDLYNISGKIYFSEITFFTGGGFIPFEPEQWDNTFGEYIELPSKKNRSR